MTAEWITSTLGEVAERVIGRTPPSKDERYWTSDTSERPFCSITDMGDRLIFPTKRGITALAEKEGKAKRVPAGSLLLSFKLSLGKVGFAGADLFPNEAIAWLEPKSVVVKAFLALALESIDWDSLGSRAVKGKTLNSDSLDSLPISYPPLAEQQRIVDLIGSLDEAIEAAEDETSVISHFLVAAREAIPAGNEIAFGKLLKGIDSGVSVLTPNELASELEPQVLKLSAVKPGFFVPEEAKGLSGAFLPERARLREGDLLMTRANTPDRVGYVCVARGVRPESYMPDLVWRLLVDTSLVSADFLEQVLSSTEIRRRVTATATGTSSSMKKISKAKIATILIPVPSLDQQADYVHLTQAIGSERSASEEYAASLRHLRANLLTTLLSGAHEIPESYDDQLPEAV